MPEVMGAFSVAVQETGSDQICQEAMHRTDRQPDSAATCFAVRPRGDSLKRCRSRNPRCSAVMS